MELTVLGANHLESSSSWPACLLIDGVLALDAGSLSSGLSLEEQGLVKAILITHQHFDHSKDLPLIGLATPDTTIEVCGQADTLRFLRSHLFDGEIYPRMDQWPSPDKPSFRLRPIEPFEQVQVAGYRVKPLPVGHGTVPAVGYEVVSGDGRTLFYTGDAGRGVSSCWDHTSPHMLAIETSFPDRMQEAALRNGHLTPALLETELLAFRTLKGYLPDILVIHLNPALEEDIIIELSRVAARLGVRITPGRRHMKLHV